MWYVATGIVADNAGAGFYLRIFPSFQVANPTNLDPLIVQKVVIAEGIMPRGLLV
jgi:hypothetical protein